MKTHSRTHTHTQTKTRATTIPIERKICQNTTAHLPIYEIYLLQRIRWNVSHRMCIWHILYAIYNELTTRAQWHAIAMWQIPPQFKIFSTNSVWRLDFITSCHVYILCVPAYSTREIRLPFGSLDAIVRCCTCMQHTDQNAKYNSAQSSRYKLFGIWMIRIHNPLLFS